MGKCDRATQARLRSARLEIAGVVAERNSLQAQIAALHAAWEAFSTADGNANWKQRDALQQAWDDSTAAAEAHDAAIRRAALEEAGMFIQNQMRFGAGEDANLNVFIGKLADAVRQLAEEEGGTDGQA